MIRKALLLSMFVAGPAAADDGPLRLNVNLASYELEVWEGEEMIRSYTATIGTSEFPTPTGGFQITRIEWNPRWTPPPSPWARGKEEAPPGPNNPMGRVKMQFDDYLYVHGTSQIGRLGSAASHGCIRLSNADALDLARLLASRTGAISSAEIDRLEGSSRRTHSVRLPTPIPIHIRSGGESGEDPHGWRETSRPPEAGVGLAMTSKRGSVPFAEARAMNPRYHGPEILPPASEVKKRVEEHLESLPTWKREPREELGAYWPGSTPPRVPGRTS